MLMLTCVKGLNGAVEAELAEKLKDYVIVRQDRGFVFIDYNGHPRRLLDLRSVEDIFYVLIQEEGFTRSRSSLSLLEEKIKYASFSEGLKYHAQLYSAPKHTTFQIFAHLYGRWNFRRIDLEKVVSQTIAGKFNKWKATHGAAKIEFDVRLFKSGELILSLRLSDKYFSNRRYKVFERPGSLKPTVAYALICLSRPRDSDVFVDPFCGSGTILMERSLVGPARQILGFDQNAEAIAATQENTASRSGIELQQADATALPLQNSSVDVIVTNPPFGQTFTKKPDLFLRFLGEASRVLKPGGRLVVINGDITGFEAALQNTGVLKLKQKKDLYLLGEETRVWVLGKIPSSK